MNDNTYHCIGCDGHHGITIHTDEEEPFLIIEDFRHIYGGFWARAKSAWDILVHGECLFTEIMLTPETAASLAEEILMKSGMLETEPNELAPKSQRELLVMLSAPRIS